MTSSAPFPPEWLKAQFPDLTVRPDPAMPVLALPADGAPALLRCLRDRCGYDLLADLTAVDWAAGAAPRFTVVYHLLSTSSLEYVRVIAACASADAPAAPTVTGLWPGADWHERECFDLFGIQFAGHPDLRRILMWDGYPYHPLRKDFPLAGLPTELPDEEVAAETGTKVIAAPMAGGPFVAHPDGTVTAGREPRALDQAWSEKKEKPAG